MSSVPRTHGKGEDDSARLFNEPLHVLYHVCAYFNTLSQTFNNIISKWLIYTLVTLML